MYHPSLEPRTNFTAIQALLKESNIYLDWPAEKVFEIKPAVSGWSIGYHLHHLAKAHGSIPKLIERLQSGALGDESLAPIPEGIQLIRDGIIPRGRQAPEKVVPPAELTHEVLVRDFGRMENAAQRIEPLLDELHAIPRRFPHFRFGPLTALEWLRFMQNHHRHHLGIIKEIEAG
ncbi:MAG: DinB family protein [Rhodothermales bacterium]